MKKTIIITKVYKINKVWEFGYTNNTEPTKAPKCPFVVVRGENATADKFSF